MELEQLKAKKAALEKRIAAAASKLKLDIRRADTHLKAALGGAVLIALANPNFSSVFKIYLLQTANQGVQKAGLARARFERLQAQYVPIVNPVEPSS